MPAGIDDLECKVGKGLLRGADLHCDGLSIAAVHTARVYVQGEFGVDQIAMILKKPPDSVGGSSFFIGGEGDNQIAGGPVAFLAESDQRRDEKCIALFDVLCAAAVKKSILLDELERIGGPVLAARFDDVEVA